MGMPQQDAIAMLVCSPDIKVPFQPSDVSKVEIWMELHCLSATSPSLRSTYLRSPIRVASASQPACTSGWLKEATSAMPTIQPGSSISGSNLSSQRIAMQQLMISQGGIVLYITNGVYALIPVFIPDSPCPEVFRHVENIGRL
ncbi:hypothetical protein ACP4OV_025480 [Aristida adscensionis]